MSDNPLATKPNVSQATIVTIQISDQIGRTVRYIAKWAVIALVGWEVSDAVIALAGHETNLNIALSAWIETKAGITISASLTVGALGVVYGQWQDKLRRRTVTRMGNRISELELQIDPNRTSSGLSREGLTPRLMDN